MNEAINTPQASESGATVSNINAQTEATIAAARARIKRPRKETIGNADRGTATAGKNETQEILKELERLYSPESFAPIVSAPSHLAVMVTGRKLWELSKDEVRALSSSASTSAKYFLSTDPKWVALSMFLVSTATIYGTRLALHIREVRNEKNGEKKNDG